MMHTTVSYVVFKTVRRKATIYYAEWAPNSEDPSCKAYRLYCGVAPFTYCAMVEDAADCEDFEATMRASAMRCDTEGDALALACRDLTQPRDAEGRVKTVIEPRTGSEVIYATHNFCDKTTWYGQSTRVTDGVLADSGDGLRFTSGNANWIDMVSGRILDDDGVSEEQMELNPSDPHGYLVTVKVNGVIKTAREPFEDAGGDYSIDYDEGTITFFEDQSGKTVTASYNHAAGSVFTIAPLPGTVLSIETAEADFSAPIVMTDTIAYAVFGYADVFAPHLVENGTVPSGTKIELKKARYKRYGQILTEALGAYPTLAKNAATAEHMALRSYPEFRRLTRGSKDDRQAVPFRYGTVRELHAAAGMELRVWLEHDRMFGGEHATLTFYCTSRKA